MAEISKYQAHSVGRLFLHNNRQENDGVTHSNLEIDNDRTYMNYNLKKGSPEEVKNRTHELYHAKRKDLVVLAEVIVTLPQDVREEDEEKFFKACYDFYCADFGEENIMNAVVHKDETTPHIHIDFMPVKPLEQDLSMRMRENVDEYERENNVKVKGMLCAKDVLTRNYFQQMHPRLYDYMAQTLGYECEILNGATAGGNKSVLEMKMERYQKEVEAKGVEAEMLGENVNDMLTKLDELGIDRRFFDMHEVLTMMEKLQTENEMYRDIVAQYDIPLPQTTMRKIADLAESLKSNLTMHTGAYEPSDVFVIETFKNEPRKLPQQDIINANPTLKYMVEVGMPKEVLIRELAEEKKVILFPTDNIEDTFHNLMKIKGMEKEFKRISFPQISNDNIHLAETVLKECHFDTDYYLTEKRRLEEAERELEQSEKNDLRE